MKKFEQMDGRYLSGVVKSAELCDALKKVQVARKNAAGNIVEIAETDANGMWQLTKANATDTISFAKEGFITKSINPNDLHKITRLLDDRLIGYQKKLWFQPGERVDVFVNALKDFSARLFRHGLTKGCVIDMGNVQKLVQRVPDGFFVESGLNWIPSLTYKIPESAVPGLYSLLLDSDDQEPFAIPMVISTKKNDRGKKSKLLVLASTNTWQSYNIWGGRSRYRNFEKSETVDFANLNSTRHMIKSKIAKLLPLGLKASIRHILKQSIESEAFKYKKLTILRPYTNCSLEDDDVMLPFTNHLAAAEWRLLAWLEREDVDYDIISGAELHNEPDLLKKYQAIILSGHCEYWTREMYAGLKQYHKKNNLWILNLSGNTMYREIEFYEDGSTRCVSLSFAYSCADETKLLGVRFTEDDLSTCAPYKIVKPEHWAFKNIPDIQELYYFGEVSLNQNTARRFSRYDPGRPGDKIGLVGSGASGWETDKLSKTAPGDFTLIAKGLNENGGAEMVIREPDGFRGGVFSASSITFGASLLVDAVASALTKNIISRALSKGCPRC